jgi:DNA-binding transcriptional LysR family regulator
MAPDYLDTRQLEAFVAVMSIGSMTGAAKALGKSPSVVTRLIQDLEQELGFLLLQRNGPQITPTEQGINFHADAKTFLAGLMAIGDSARGIAGADARPIEIASIPSIASSLIPRALSSLPAQIFPIHVHVNSTASENVLQAVVTRTADVGVASLPLDNPGVDVHWVGEVPCVAIVSIDDPLAQKARLMPQDLATRRLIASANPYRLRLRIDQAIGDYGITPNGIIDSNATYVSLSLARAGLGIAIVESATILGLPLDGVKVIALGFHIPFHWGVITASGRPLPPSVATLINGIERAAEGISGFVKHLKNDYFSSK